MGRSAGVKLRAKLNAALKAAGPGMEWTETEAEAIAAAVQAADRAEQLRAVFGDELVGESRPTTLARLSAEIRLCERQVVEMVSRLELEPVKPKSLRHQRAVNARWDRKRRADEPRVGPRPVEVVQ